MMRSIRFWLLTTLLLTTVSPSLARQSAKQIPRIGLLRSGSAASHVASHDAFRAGLRELGYEEGKNIQIDYRYAEGKTDRWPALVKELVGLKVDVIVTAGAGLITAAQQTTRTIPIVAATASDLVGSGLVASLARPGGNITGLSTLAPELTGKKLEILKEVLPRLARLAVITTPTVVEPAEIAKELKLVATALKIHTQQLDVYDPKDFESAFREAQKARADAVLMRAGGPIAVANRKKTPELAIKTRLSVMYRGIRDVEAGGLMYYGVNQNELDRRVATYVDKILKGRKPADLPVEQPKKFEFVVNLNAAKSINLTIPPNVLVRADRVIR